MDSYGVLSIGIPKGRLEKKKGLGGGDVPPCLALLGGLAFVRSLDRLPYLLFPPDITESV